MSEKIKAMMLSPRKENPSIIHGKIIRIPNKSCGDSDFLFKPIKELIKAKCLYCETLETSFGKFTLCHDSDAIALDRKPTAVFLDRNCEWIRCDGKVIIIRFTDFSQTSLQGLQDEDIPKLKEFLVEYCEEYLR